MHHYLEHCILLHALGLYLAGTVFDAQINGRELAQQGEELACVRVLARRHLCCVVPTVLIFGARACPASLRVARVGLSTAWREADYKKFTVLFCMKKFANTVVGSTVGITDEDQDDSALENALLHSAIMITLRAGSRSRQPRRCIAGPVCTGSFSVTGGVHDSLFTEAIWRCFIALSGCSACEVRFLRAAQFDFLKYFDEKAFFQNEKTFFQNRP